ncbi:MAG: hypothetical protein GWM92_13450 [Gemmatimonadetes bacterium]|nr:hypothetical protein [Gemmatimonadota bacterium]NIR79716.1 hypothetical protein [Gemmatimonadota bacterium]NIT88422.1 hypothetical protein [Gemmatimonadota bacterium]NIU32237.1 hypothetical protein [Gemmatimonadota bacterium]NIU36778.1 hypothetical protein [Gemmatimonadota bacterium]
MSGTGYRQIVSHLRGELTLDETVERIATATRQYSRRQLTWFRNQLPEGTVRIRATDPLERQVEGVLGAWRRAVASPTEPPGRRTRTENGGGEVEG